MLARTYIKKKNSLSRGLVLFAALVLAIMLLAFVMLRPAQGSGGVSGDTIGIGAVQSTQTSEEGTAEDERDVSSEDEPVINDKNVLQTTTLTNEASRHISVEDPDPVVVLAAIDTSNPFTMAKALEVGTMNPLPTAPHILPDTNEEGWKTGLASAYDLETNQGWDATASGVLLNRESVTVAVPANQAHLLGSAVEIVYGDKVVVATVTDTGGFAKYGRSLDFAAGVWKALGADSYDDWGVRTVHYRFL